MTMLNRSLRALGFVLVFTAMSATAFAIPTPELDPASASSAIALLSCGVLLLSGRVRRK